jgi:hypothetical protein
MAPFFSIYGVYFRDDGISFDDFEFHFDKVTVITNETWSLALSPGGTYRQQC